MIESNGQVELVAYKLTMLNYELPCGSGIKKAGVTDHGQNRAVLNGGHLCRADLSKDLQPME